MSIEIIIAELTQVLHHFQSATGVSDEEMVAVLTECAEMHKRKILLKQLTPKKESLDPVT